MHMIETSDRFSIRRMTTQELRDRFVIENLFQQGKANLVYTNVDRAVVGGIVPWRSRWNSRAAARWPARIFVNVGRWVSSTWAVLAVSCRWHDP